MLYEITTLSCPLLSLDDVAKRALAFLNETAGHELVGCWKTEFGALGRVLVLRGFGRAERLAAERERALLHTDPFYGAKVVTALDLASYRPFPFLPPGIVARRGKVYEFRTYWLKPGGLAPTMAAWEAAIAPARAYTDHLVVNMYALDGAPRITHI